MVKRLRRGLARIKDEASLALTPRSKVNAKNLRMRSSVSLPELFSSKELADLWLSQASALQRFDIPGSAHGVNPGDRRAIYYLIRHFAPGNVLEVGTHIGASLVHIVLAMGGNGRVVAVDIEDVNSPAAQPWLKYGSKQSPMAMVQSLGYQSSVTFVADSSLHYMGETKERFDFIFLDGDHHARTVYREIPLALHLLKPNGVILLHDYFPDSKPLWPESPFPIRGPYLATERFKREKAEIVALALGDLPWPTKLGTNTTSLALLLRA